MTKNRTKRTLEEQLAKATEKKEQEAAKERLIKGKIAEKLRKTKAHASFILGDELLKQFSNGDTKPIAIDDLLKQLSDADQKCVQDVIKSVKSQA